METEKSIKKGGVIMRKAFMLCVLAAALTSCGIGRTEQTAAPPAASQTAEHTITKPISAATSATKEKGKTSVSSISTKASESKKTSRSTTKSAAQTVSETIKADTSHTTARSSVRHESTTLTPKSVTDSRQTVTSASKARIAERTAAAAEKPKAVTTVKTTAKPEKSMDTKVTAKTKNTAKEEIIYVEIENVTSLETMTKELENSSTPPSYYERIGKELANDGTDYGKARAVYNWMRENGHGSCVYYSMETYFVCKGVGLECAYGFATDNGWYGHTYSVVKVEGVWYVMDTQGGSFLDNTNYCTRMFDGNDRDILKFKEDIWYDYDENGEYRDWT